MTFKSGKISTNNLYIYHLWNKTSSIYVLMWFLYPFWEEYYVHFTNGKLTLWSEETEFSVKSDFPPYVLGWLSKQLTEEVSLWHRGLRIQCCCSCDPDHNCEVGSILLAWELPHVVGAVKNKNKQATEEEMDLSNSTQWQKPTCLKGPLQVSIIVRNVPT